MLTLIATALGLVSSAIPDVLKLWKDKEAKKHDIKLLELKMESMKLGHALSVDEINAKSDASQITSVYDHASLPSNVNWIEGLRASVRPIITYAFFILFAFVKISIFVLVIRAGADIFTGSTYIWDEDDKALFATMMGFWFGHRALQRHKELNK